MLRICKLSNEITTLNKTRLLFSNTYIHDAGDILYPTTIALIIKKTKKMTTHAKGRPTFFSFIFFDT